MNPDGSIEIKADFDGPNGASGSTEALTVVVDRNADSAATEAIGPGSLNLLTGDFLLSETDVSQFGLSVERSASSRTPAATQDGQLPIFGKEWVSGTTAELTDSDYSYLRRISDTAVDVVTADDSSIHFTANTARTGWIPEPGSEYLTLTGSTAGSFTLTETEGVVTEFTKPAGATTWQVSSSRNDGQTVSTTSIESKTVTVDGKELARPERIFAPTSATTTAACKADPSTKGCRILQFVYATATTATDTAYGDYNGQVKEVRPLVDCAWCGDGDGEDGAELRVRQHRPAAADLGHADLSRSEDRVRLRQRGPGHQGHAARRTAVDLHLRQGGREQRGR